MTPAVFQKFVDMFNLLSLNPGNGMDAVVEHRKGALADLMVVTDNAVGEIAVCTDYDCLVYYGSTGVRKVVPSGKSIFDIRPTCGSGPFLVQDTRTQMINWQNNFSWVTGYYGHITLPDFVTSNVALPTGTRLEYDWHISVGSGTPGANVTIEVVLEDNLSAPLIEDRLPDRPISTSSLDSTMTGVFDADGNCVLDLHISASQSYYGTSSYDRVQLYLTQDGAAMANMTLSSYVHIYLPMYSTQNAGGW